MEFLSHLRPADQDSCSHDWTSAAAAAEYKYVWTGNRTKSPSDCVQLQS